MFAGMRQCQACDSLNSSVNNFNIADLTSVKLLFEHETALTSFRDKTEMIACMVENIV